MEIICFDANVSACGVVLTCVTLVLTSFIYLFYLYAAFLPARTAVKSKKACVCAPGCFVRQELNNKRIHPILIIMFEAEILKIFKNIQPQPKN